MSRVFSFWHFSTGPQNLKKLKHKANDEPGFMSDLFTGPRYCQKLKKIISLQKTMKMDLIFMNMSIYQKSTLGGPVKKQFVLQSCFFNLLPRHTNFF